MIDRLKYTIKQKLKADEEVVLNGYCPTLDTYRSYTECRKIMLWVLEEIDKLENGFEEDEDDPSDVPRVDEI